MQHAWKLLELLPLPALALKLGSKALDIAHGMPRVDQVQIGLSLISSTGFGHWLSEISSELQPVA